MKHTKEPWRLGVVGGGRKKSFIVCVDEEIGGEVFDSSLLSIVYEENIPFACFYDNNDARRIVQCVNDCTGLKDPKAYMDKLKAQLDEVVSLVKACICFMSSFELNTDFDEMLKEQNIERLEARIARIEKEDSE